LPRMEKISSKPVVMSLSLECAQGGFPRVK